MLTAMNRAITPALWAWLVGSLLSVGVIRGGQPVDFDIPSQRTDRALAQFAHQSGVDILYTARPLRSVRSSAVHGNYLPADALVILLRGTGFRPTQQNGSYAVVKISPPPGTLVGRIEPSNGESASGTTVRLPALQRLTTTNLHGEYRFNNVTPGDYRVVAERAGFRSLEIATAEVVSNRRTQLAVELIYPQSGVQQLEAFVVEGRLDRHGPLDPGPTVWGPRRAGGNLDLHRSMNDALPFIVYDRDRITRSGAVNLNEFLRRELLDTDATSLPPEQQINGRVTSVGSSNLSLRGFSAEETVVLVNGRRLPEILSVGSPPQAPDVNFIPLSLVQQIQVLPASASALYSGNAVGGVINILLRPDDFGNHTEVTVTYTNATENFDAATSYVSLLHNQVLLDGRLSVRFNANFTDAEPATEAELNHRRNVPVAPAPDDRELFAATPNIRSADGSPLVPGSPFLVSSIAPGLAGPAAAASLRDRVGIRNYDGYDSPGAMANALGGLDYPYGRRQDRSLFYLSSVLEALPQLELGFDAAYSKTIINRGYQVQSGDLLVRAQNPINPFDRDVFVSLYETPFDLGEDYDEATLDFYTLVGSALLDLPWDLQLAIDTQYAFSKTKYRGIDSVDNRRWQALVDRGDYDPFRDTQVHLADPAFYDEVLVYTEGRGEFATLGEYETIDGAVRLTQETLSLPTGQGVLNAGADYRISTLSGVDSPLEFGDGTEAKPAQRWAGRTLERVSVFSELQAPLLPREKLPSWIRSWETNLAARYIMADTSAESNLAPTVALKLGLQNGLTLRGSFTTSNRFPTPFMSSRISTGIGGGGGAPPVSVYDPRRDERYDVQSRLVVNTELGSENAVTQTMGLIYERGEQNHFRVSLDFFDTRKTNEIFGLGPTELLDLEAFFPELVERGAPDPARPDLPGRVTTLFTTSANLSERHSQNWMGSVDFARREIWGGTIDLRARIMYFQKYEAQVIAAGPTFDEIGDPSGSSANLLEYRATFGGGWSNAHFGIGFDGQYFHSQRLPRTQWAGHGARTIDPFWQADVFVQGDLGHWLFPADSRFGLKGQLRVNNVANNRYPRDGNSADRSGVRPYGDWRGRTYSISLTAEF
jgi:iron complex outermembrane recepter protein